MQEELKALQGGAGAAGELGERLDAKASVALVREAVDTRVERADFEAWRCVGAL
jgi:hypothetical protein